MLIDSAIQIVKQAFGPDDWHLAPLLISRADILLNQVGAQVDRAPASAVLMTRNETGTRPLPTSSWGVRSEV